MTSETTIYIGEVDTAESFRRERDERGMTNEEYLNFLLSESELQQTTEQLIKQTEILNEKLGGVVAGGDHE